MANNKTIIGKIKGKPDVFWATIETNKTNDLNHHQRVKTTDLLNLTYLEFLLCTKKPSKDTINFNKLIKLIKLNTESYIDWAVIELLTKDILTLEGTSTSTPQATLRQDTQVTLLQDTKVKSGSTLPQGTQVALPQGTQVILQKKIQLQATLPQDTQATLPQDTQVALPQDTQVALPQGTQVTPAISSIIELTFEIDGKTIKVKKEDNKWVCEAKDKALEALRELIDFWK